MAVLYNEDGEILMMQEAKSSCAGQWYLPAGRMEPGEDIEGNSSILSHNDSISVDVFFRMSSNWSTWSTFL
ncbi:8-hydroxy-dADP phosphatase activity protein [Homalodisca vitripennis]|nr:8-hydroxy-dADP phosphatase activity protein [Homalodisca vitripennis]